MSGRKAVQSQEAPAAVGPYSQAVSSGGFLFCSGSLPIDPVSGNLVDDSIGSEATQSLKNLRAVCRAAGAELSSAVRLTVFTTEMDQFGEINEAYGKFFSTSPPARAAVGVAALPLGARVEIDAIVALE